MDQKRALQSDRSSFEAVCLPLMPVVYGVARRLSRHEADASDLVQETYLRAYRTYGNFEPGTNAKAWLLTIMRSVFINAYHRRRRVPEAAAADDEAMEQAIAAQSLNQYTEGQLAARISDWSGEIDSALHALPESYRMVVTLIDMQDCSYEETAGIMECPVGTVRSRLHRARALLAGTLADVARRTGIVQRVAEPTR